MSEPHAQSLRAVLDTNVLVRGLTRAMGPSRDLLKALVDMKAFVLVTSMEILAELGVEWQGQATTNYTSFMSKYTFSR